MNMTSGKLIIPSPVENATVQEVLKNGELYTYHITPNEGYKLHDKDYDEAVTDEETYEETGEVTPGYRTSTASVKADYDWTENNREFYTAESGDENDN